MRFHNSIHKHASLFVIEAVARISKPTVPTVGYMLNDAIRWDSPPSDLTTSAGTYRWPPKLISGISAAKVLATSQAGGSLPLMQASQCYSGERNLELQSSKFISHKCRSPHRDLRFSFKFSFNFPLKFDPACKIPKLSRVRTPNHERLPSHTSSDENYRGRHCCSQSI